MPAQLHCILKGETRQTGKTYMSRLAQLHCVQVSKTIQAGRTFSCLPAELFCIQRQEMTGRQRQDKVVVGCCRLLTMERLHGVPLTDLSAIRSMTSAEPEQTLITALNTWFGSVLGCETFHADVHAGGSLQVSHTVVPCGSHVHLTNTWHALAFRAASTCTDLYADLQHASIGSWHLHEHDDSAIHADCSFCLFCMVFASCPCCVASTQAKVDLEHG